MKRVLFFLLSLVMVLSALTLPAFAAEEGVRFNAWDLYQAKKPLSELPLTVEATFRLPADASPGGVVIGNYARTNTIDCLNLEIHNGGKPRLYCVDDHKNTNVLTFDQVNVLTGDWVHLAIVVDPANAKADCYVNGVLKQTLTDIEYPTDVTVDKVLCLGGDWREDNPSYFKGEIRSVALYRDQRTAEEIAADAVAALPATDDMILGYAPQLDAYGSAPTAIADLSGNGYDQFCEKAFVDHVEIKDYAYSMAVIGDTQYLSLRYPEVLDGLYDWIVENAEEQKIKFVFGLGDITDTSTEEEWERAKAAIHQLDGVVPYSLVRGNHDTAETFKTAFPMEDYKKVIKGSYDGSMLNTYQTFKVGDIDYLAIAFEYYPLTDAVLWASDIVEQHPNHQVIITVHDYINSSAELETTGEKMWENLVKKHENIVLVLNGHYGEDTIQFSQMEGDNGNIVTAMMIDAQYKDLSFDGLGMVTMLYFSEDGKQVQLRHYSTAKDTYFREVNQFDFTLAPEYIHYDVNFIDVEGHWGKDYILPLAERGIIKGKTKTTFEPEANITRAEFLTLALNVAGIETQNRASYTDVSTGAWFSATVATAKNLGLIDENMVENDHFYPDQNITREEMTSIIVKLCEVKNLPAADGDVSGFSDREAFSAWASPYIGKAVALGVVTGNPDGSFNARGNATRAEAAVIFSRLLNLL